MATVLVFEEEFIKVICAYAPQVGRSECEKDQFYNDIASGLDFVLVVKSNTKYLKDVKAIAWVLQHRLVVTAINKRK